MANYRTNALSGGILSTEYLEPCWYAVYTSANHEKRVASQLDIRSVTHFLPLYDSVRRWKDRCVRLQLPLFPGYLFVRIAIRDRLRVLQVPGIARLVGFNGMPVPLPDHEVECLKFALAKGMRAEPHPYMKVGRRMRITSGSLAGCEGMLVRKKGNMRLILSVDLIQRSIMVDLDVSAVEPVFDSKKATGDIAVQY